MTTCAPTASTDRRLSVRLSPAELALLEAERARMAKAAPGVRLTLSDTLRSLIERLRDRVGARS